MVNFGMTLAMYATPVICAVSAVSAHYRWVTQINPLTVLMEGFRPGFLGVGIVTVGQIAASFGMMLVVLAVGLMLFTHAEPIFMDTV
jgi:lipopolysaccharide transport system permease protein